MENSTWIWFHVYTSLKWKTMLAINLHAPNIMTQMRYVPSKLHFNQPGVWNEGSLSRSWKDSTRILRDLNQRLDSEKGFVSFFRGWYRNKLSSDILIHFLTSLPQDKELCSSIVSFFNKVDTRQGTILSGVANLWWSKIISADTNEFL